MPVVRFEFGDIFYVSVAVKGRRHLSSVRAALFQLVFFLVPGCCLLFDGCLAPFPQCLSGC